MLASIVCYWLAQLMVYKLLVGMTLRDLGRCLRVTFQTLLMSMGGKRPPICMSGNSCAEKIFMEKEVVTGWLIETRPKVRGSSLKLNLKTYTTKIGYYKSVNLYIQ